VVTYVRHVMYGTRCLLCEGPGTFASAPGMMAADCRSAVTYARERHVWGKRHLSAPSSSSPRRSRCARGRLFGRWEPCSPRCHLWHLCAR